MTKDELKFMKNHSKMLVDAIETVIILLQEEREKAQKNYELYKELSKPIK